MKLKSKSGYFHEIGWLTETLKINNEETKEYYQGNVLDKYIDSLLNECVYKYKNNTKRFLLKLFGTCKFITVQ